MGMLLAVPILAAGCADQPVINTGEPPTPPASGSATPSTPTSNARLVNAFDYVGHVGEITSVKRLFDTPIDPAFPISARGSNN